jgi:rubrerythrin
MIPKELTSLEVLGIGIRSEMDAQDVYQEMAQRICNPRAKERFHLLVAEERQHQTLLEEKYRQLFPDATLKLPPSMLPPKASTADLRRGMSLLDVLDIAIQEERHSRDFYLEGARHVEDLSGKAMLKFLADWEYTHQMELTIEYDMLIKYPNYYEDVAEPWQEELGLRKERI